MAASPSVAPQIREDVLRDPRHPVHRIADQLRPYLQVLVDQFHPEQVILFGSYAYGEPTPDSDVDLLYPLEGATESVIELLQEASERFLKAYLIAGGWNLRKIHDLGALVAEAVNLDCRFTAFEEFADNLTDQFWAQHYPGGDLDGVGRDYPALRHSLNQLVTLIEAALQTKA